MPQNDELLSHVNKIQSLWEYLAQWQSEIARYVLDLEIELTEALPDMTEHRRLLVQERLQRVRISVCRNPVVDDLDIATNELRAHANGLLHSGHE